MVSMPSVTQVYYSQRGCHQGVTATHNMVNFKASSKGWSLAGVNLTCVATGLSWWLLLKKTSWPERSCSSPDVLPLNTARAPNRLGS